MPSQGYVRYPTIHRDRIVFVSEDDLWLVSSEGGRASRLTAGLGEVSLPRFSPDGSLLAFVGREEGPGEVYAMPAAGGVAQRLTYQGASCRVAGWAPGGEAILYASNAGQFAQRFEVLYAISPDGGEPRKLSFGLANAISYGQHGGVVIGRNMNVRDFSYQKRYRGGRVGHLWLDIDGSGNFQRLLRLDGNIADPCWVGERIYFLSDHEGVGNVYSCTPQGEDVRRHTYHNDFYARHLSSDGLRLVYHAGADLYLFDPSDGVSHHLDVELPSIRTQRQRKFSNAGSYLDSYRLHPHGYAVAVTTRGKAFTMGNWDGPVLQHGELDGVRYRKLNWLNDGKRLVAVHDATGYECLVVFNPDDGSEPQTFPGIEFGRVAGLDVSPTDDMIALTNHRNELVLVDLEKSEMRVLDRSDYGRIEGFDWSPDGRWIAYGFPFTNQKTAIKLCNIETSETHFVTDPILEDVDPAFDPEGKYLYFLGHRILNPVYDSLQFDLSFPRGTKPYVITLQRDLRSPFMPEPKAPGEKEKDKEKNNGKKEKEKEEADKDEDADANEEGADKEQEEKAEKNNDDKRPPDIVIDLEGITHRVLPFPVAEARYYGIAGIKGKALFMVYPIRGALHDDDDDQEAQGHLDSFDFEKQKYEMLIDRVGSYTLSRDYKTLMYRNGHRLRVLKAGDKPSKVEGDRAGRESGWLDLSRVKVSIQPAAEWKQMFNEAWRLQREHFWTEDMSGIDWDAIYAQYAPLVERVSSRSELSDLFWEFQGELNTSHAYEMGGEYRWHPYYRQGFLGVDWRYDGETQRYRIERIVIGDPADPKATSPLNSPGLNVVEGDAVLAINGQRVGPDRSPQELLVNQARNEVQLTIEDGKTQQTRVITVKAISDEMPARYREWVEGNRRYVHEQSENKVGYVHIPDMSAIGFAEFHRTYLTEYDYPSLLVDVRFNGGGHVSGLLLEKLARRRVGYDFPRWGQPIPYPRESPRGPMVALTNEHAGSDWDIFSHSFKLMGLGPLIGKRTWGGVIGNSYRHTLVDGTRTTQPEFAYWFKDVGWNVENYGTDPDIEVDIAPQDFATAVDQQLDRAISEALRMIEERPALEPKPEERPRKVWR
jgi:tricorn protease